MKHKRLRKEHGDFGRGFSRWIQPVPDGYIMACCDCGLVHEMKFRAFLRGKVRANGTYDLKVLPKGKYGVRLRARRAERYTRRERMKMKPKARTITDSYGVTITVGPATPKSRKRMQETAKRAAASLKRLAKK